MVDDYKHLNNEKAYNVSFDIEQLANMICDCNYGLHRFMSAVINKYENTNSEHRKKVAQELRNLIESGIY